MSSLPRTRTGSVNVIVSTCGLDDAAFGAVRDEWSARWHAVVGSRGDHRGASACPTVVTPARLLTGDAGTVLLLPEL